MVSTYISHLNADALGNYRGSCLAAGRLIPVIVTDILLFAQNCRENFQNVYPDHRKRTHMERALQAFNTIRLLKNLFKLVLCLKNAKFNC